MSFKKNETIFKQGMPITHVVFVKSGLVKAYKEQNNAPNLILNINTSNQYIGLITSFGSNKYEYAASTLIESELVFIDLTTFTDIMIENGRFGLHLFKQVCKLGLQMFDKLLNLSHKQLPGRIAGILLFFSNEIFKSEDFELPLNRQELAELISSTKESVSRVLSEFKHDKIIDMVDRRITIKSPDLLTRLSRIG